MSDQEIKQIRALRLELGVVKSRAGCWKDRAKIAEEHRDETRQAVNELCAVLEELILVNEVESPGELQSMSYSELIEHRVRPLLRRVEHLRD